MVLEKLQECGLYAKLEKCFFHQPSVEFLGYIISSNGISMDPKKIQTIIEWNQPSSIKRCTMFFRICKFLQDLYQRVFQNCGSINKIHREREFCLG
jgi:hypothetical protein